MDKYIGRTVEIIYLKKNGEFSKRHIQVRVVTEGVVKAYCLKAKAPRIFLIKNILAVQPVTGHAV